MGGSCQEGQHSSLHPAIHLLTWEVQVFYATTCQDQTEENGFIKLLEAYFLYLELLPILNGELLCSRASLDLLLVLI